MRPKLHAFRQFSDTLLPLEAEYLASIHRFEDPVRVDILSKVVENTRVPVHFDEMIDKRKYSSLKKWMQENLLAIDVDHQFSWLSSLENEIYVDRISAVSEKKLMGLIGQTDASWFHFQKLYELLRLFRHYLTVRMRHAQLKEVEAYLSTYEAAHNHARSVSDRLYAITKEIADSASTDPAVWEKQADWLTHIFYNEQLDGHNRILAFVRLIFLSYNLRKYDLIPDKLTYLERRFSQGELYSKRILINYYSQCLLYHAQEQDFERAVEFGYLTLRHRNADYLYYANNLAAVLLRLHRPEEALEVLRDASPDARKASSFHNRIGHAAYIIGAYNMLGKYQQAETHALVLLKVYRREILNHRWHLFFTNYWEALLKQGKSRKILQSDQSIGLIQRDARNKSKPNYTPTLPWMWTIAAYLEGKLSREKASMELKALHDGMRSTPLPAAISHLIQATSKMVPELYE